MEERDIIADIRAYRDAYAARFGYDFGAMVRDIQSRQRAGGRVVLPPPPAPPPEPEIEPIAADRLAAKAG